MSKIAVLVDSGCQIEIGSLEEQGIFVVPLNITIGDKTYRDQIDITSLEVFDKMEKEDILAKTSQPATGDILEMIKKIKTLGYDHIIGIPIATGLSSTLQGMKIACDMENMPVTLIDSKGTASNQKYLAITASKLIKEGKEVEEITKIITSMVENSATMITAPNLNHLKRGGRITPAVALLGGMLKIVPVMKLNYELGGKIDTYGKVRTIKKANQVIIDHFINDCGVNNTDYVLMIEHVLKEDLALQMKDYLISKIGKCEVEVRELPSVVGVHMGVGGIGMQFIKKYKG